MRSGRANCLAMVLLACAATSAAAAESSRAPAGVALSTEQTAADFASPREAALLADLADGRLAADSVFEAALTAQDPASDAAWQRARGQFSAHLARLTTSLPPHASRDERARGAYRYLHGEILTGQYITECSDLTVALSRGDYNCLSATVLYMALCQGVAVPVEAVARPGHVYCRLAEGGEVVETTCPQWFSLTLAERQRAPRAAAGTPSAGGDRPLSRAELLGKVYYNRGLADMERREFSAAIAHFELAARLDARDAAARENVLAALNNGALALSDAGEWAQAAELVLRGRRLDSQYAPLVANDLHIHRLWLIALAREGRDAQAAAILAELARRQNRPELVSQWSRDLGIELDAVHSQGTAGL